MKFVLLIIFLSVLIERSEQLTTAEVANMETAITNFYEFVPSYGEPCNPCAQGDNVGALVRLVFHDAFGGGGPQGAGGMNGCIDFTTTDNRGLEEVVGQLDTLYAPFSDQISKADFWLLAANLAIRYATTTTTSGRPFPPGVPASPGVLSLPFRFGRQDDTTCDDHGRLPSAGFSWSNMTAMFVDRIGLTVTQFVALLGAHTLGRAQAANSGFEGGWTVAQSTFSNLYFSSLGGVKWNNTNASNVWVDGVPQPNVLMLKIDVEPLYSPSESCPVFLNFNAPSPCTKNHAAGDPSAVVQAFATDIRSWFGNFSQGWQVLSEFEYSTLSSVTDSTSTSPTVSTQATTSSTKATSSTTQSATTQSTTRSTTSSTTSPASKIGQFFSAIMLLCLVFVCNFFL